MRPLTAGWDQVLVAPLATDLPWCEAVVPTRHGPMWLRWERTGRRWAVRGRMPERAPGELRLGLQVTSITGAATNGPGCWQIKTGAQFHVEGTIAVESVT